MMKFLRSTEKPKKWGYKNYKTTKIIYSNLILSYHLCTIYILYMYETIKWDDILSLSSIKVPKYCSMILSLDINFSMNLIGMKINSPCDIQKGILFEMKNYVYSVPEPSNWTKKLRCDAEHKFAIKEVVIFFCQKFTFA